jgi:hypothetical protein
MDYWEWFTEDRFRTYRVVSRRLVFYALKDDSGLQNLYSALGWPQPATLGFVVRECTRITNQLRPEIPTQARLIGLLDELKDLLEWLSHDERSTQLLKAVAQLREDSGLPAAVESFDTAFESWSQAIRQGPADERVQQLDAMLIAIEYDPMLLAGFLISP